MKLAATIVAGIAIYGLGGWAAWWVNRRIDLAAVPSFAMRAAIRVFVVLIVFVVATAPPVYGLAPLFD